MTPFLDALSLLLVYSAIAVYAAGFIAYTLGLARRTAPRPAPAKERVLAGPATVPPAPPGTTEPTSESAPATSKAFRVGYALTVLGWVLHVAATVLRGIAAERVPWANMFEFSLTGTALIIGTFLAVSIRGRLAFLGTAVLGLVVLLLGVATVSFYVPVVPLMPALQSGCW